LGVAPPSPVFVNGTPCSSYWAQQMATGAPPAFAAVQPYAPCGYTPAQLRGAYGVNTLTPTGSGVSVAVLDAYASPTARVDADTYATRHGGQAFAPGQYVEVTPPAYQYGYEDTVNGDLCGEQGWYGEQTLDIEAVHGVAPGAKVTYVGAASCLDTDLLDGLNTIVDGQLAQVITNSWGSTGEPDPVADSALMQAYDYVFVQAALTGIGVFFSSGDSGDEVDNSGNRTVDFPASHPWVTAVGGTSIGIGSNNNYLFETGWGTARSRLIGGAWTPAPPGIHQYGAGGGTSRTYPQPWYQRGVVPSSISQYFGGAPGRAVPDIAAIGDPNTGFLVGQTQTFPDGSARYSEYRIGGTSLSSPVLAGIEAIADQAAGHPHGFANPAIYKLPGTRSIRDVTPSGITRAVVRQDFVNGVDDTSGYSITLRTLDQTQSLATRVGYDDVTGVGTPFGPKYVYDLGKR
jgi:subtilase family serine protease